MTVADYYGVNMVETGEDTTNSLTRGERAAHLFHWRPSDCWGYFLLTGLVEELRINVQRNQGVFVAIKSWLVAFSFWTFLNSLRWRWREREREREYPSESIMDTFWVMAWAFTQQLISTDNPGWKVIQRIFTGPTSKNLKVKNTYNHTRTIPIDIHSICFYMHDPQSSWWLTTGSVFGWTGVEMHMQAIPFPVTFNTSQTKPLWKFIGCIYI